MNASALLPPVSLRQMSDDALRKLIAGAAAVIAKRHGVPLPKGVRV